MAILNGRLGKSMGEALHASVILFGVGFLFCLTVALVLTKSLPHATDLANAKPIEYLGGFIVGFYVISATLLAPRIGLANFIVCAVSAQIIISVVIDHFGLLGAMVRPVSMTRLIGIGLLIAGIIVTQISDSASTSR
jgi:transporter family-2 protein